MAHCGADGVHRSTVVRAGVGLCQVVHQQFCLLPFIYDFIPVRLCSGENLLLGKISVLYVRNVLNEIHFAS